MKYLFYDLEYASQIGGVSKICEFGYVVTDEKFNVIERNNLIINPNILRHDWDYRVVKTILTRSINEYECRPIFKVYYPKIKQLFDDADYVLGHTLDCDTKSLNDDLQRYKLPPINHTFYDVKEFYKEYKNSKQSTSVEDILKELGVHGEDKTHDAETDAYNTMLDLKIILQKLEMTLEELIEICPKVKNRTDNFLVESIEINKLIKKEQLDEQKNGDGTNEIKRFSINHKKILQFLDNVKPINKGSNVFKNKKVCISINYEEHHFKEVLNLIQLITNAGGTYVVKASLSDVFVRYDFLLKDGSIKKCSKLKYVEEAISEGKNIEIINFEELLNMLSISEEELNNMPLPSFDFLDSVDAIIKDNKEKKLRNKISGSKLDSISLGDYLKEKGFCFDIYEENK